MNIITVIPIYRGKLSEKKLFFSSHKFTIGSIIKIPIGKKSTAGIVVEVKDIREKKLFLKKEGVALQKIERQKEISFLEDKNFKETLYSTPVTVMPREIIEIIKNTPLEAILRKKIQEEREKIIKRENEEYQNRNEFGELKKIEFNIPIKKEKTSLHTEKHYLVDEIRKYFGETAKKGIGSFSFYLGFFKNIPKQNIYQYWAEVKQSRKSLKDQQKLFWWKIGDYLKKIKMS